MPRASERDTRAKNTILNHQVIYETRQPPTNRARHSVQVASRHTRTGAVDVGANVCLNPPDIARGFMLDPDVNEPKALQRNAHLFDQRTAEREFATFSPP